MCRIVLTTEGMSVAKRIAEMQTNGGTIPAEFCAVGGCAVGLNRFTVTSASSPHGVFPLDSARFTLAFNGEVYGFRERAFVDEPHFASDGHFAMDVLLQHGIQVFMREADLQGTFLIFDKESQEWWCTVDQMNIAGCYYAHWGNKLIIASESAPIHQTLERLQVANKLPIEILQPGRALCRSRSGELVESTVRPQYSRLFSNSDASDAAFDDFMQAFKTSLSESVRRRIPLDGPVGILCSGGIDSSVILTMLVNILTERGDLERLRIFTLGGTEDRNKSQDEIYTRLLLKSLELDERYLTIIPQASLEPLNRSLYEQYVFAEFPRLITPHPVLRSHVRNAVIMSSLLCAIRQLQPEVISLLTGDGADELLAGYEEMVLDKNSSEELRTEICKRVNYFPMTDGARVALAAFFGATAARLSQNSRNKSAPVEIRMPFTSHLVMESLQAGHPDFLLGMIDGIRCNKFALRVLGSTLGIPKEIVVRTKMPFVEGAVGEKMADSSPLEKELAWQWMYEMNLEWDGPELTAIRKTIFGSPPPVPESASDRVPGMTDQFAMFIAARTAGAERLLRGQLFREQPSAPSADSPAYFPANPRVWQTEKLYAQ
jgi:asparagine synthetase B (glutamine-hydrolysing)